MKDLKILSFDSSGIVCTAAVLDGDIVLAQKSINKERTHSETLLPMIDEVLQEAKTKICDIEKIAVCAGPGSFTGIRIAVATAKGIAAPFDIPCVAVSSMSAIAHSASDLPESCIISPVLDARRTNFYNAIFEKNGDNITRLCPDRLISAKKLDEELENYKKEIFLVGEGANLCYNILENKNNITLPKEGMRDITAQGVAKASKDDVAISSADILPYYIRPTQAEREYLKKQKTEE